MHPGTSTCHQVCQNFLAHVVRDHVFSDAELNHGSGPLSVDTGRLVATGQRVEQRLPSLLRISGKGGWSPVEARRATFAAFTNVTLLDHLLSVVRGALVFATVDLCARRARTEEELRRRLAAVAAIAFLHDADKMLELGRSEARQGALDATAMAGLMERFGLPVFLARHGATLTSAAVLELVNGVEATAVQGLVKVPEEHWHDRTYVRLADRVDGTFLQTRPLDGRPRFGLDGALEVIRTFEGLHTDALRGLGGRVIAIHDPHTPFLLDALQAGLSAACRDNHGFPPIIELHHDGRLLVALPEDEADAVVQAALARATGELGARIRVAINARGTLDLLDAPGTVADLRDSIANMGTRERESLLRAGKEALARHSSAIDELMRPSGFLPRPADYAGQLVPLWSGMGSNDGLVAIHRDAVLLGTVLDCADPSPRLGIPDATVRERELRDALDEVGALPNGPTVLDELPPGTRRALLAGFAAGYARGEPDLHDLLLGPGGLAALWLEGQDGRPGLSAKIDRAGIRLRAAVSAHYTALMSGCLVTTVDEEADGRCHFTNAPVSRSDMATVSGRMGLYGVKVSAFSGREGRPESFRSTESETLVSPLAEAEHKLRRLRFVQNGGSPDRREVPVTITSPTTAGLFGALPFGNDQVGAELALSDMVRSKIEAGKPTYRNAEATLRRTRVARFEELPGRMVGNGTEPGQIAFVRMACRAALRLGRPVHVFRGLPRPRPEFVAFDTMPASLAALLGGDAFRLEQVGPAIARLEGVEAVAEVTGFGLELALRLCDEATCFGAACDALARVERRLAARASDPKLNNIRFFAANLLETTAMPQPSDTALLEFADAMARVQRIPRHNDGANMAELGLRTALDTTEALERLQQTASTSLAAGIAGELEKSIARGKLWVRPELRGKRSFDELVDEAARVFVEAVWHGAFGGALPSSRDRRVALAVYRHGFKRASRELYARAGLPATEQDETSSQEA